MTYVLMLGATTVIVAIVFGLLVLISKHKNWSKNQENTDAHWFV